MRLPLLTDDGGGVVSPIHSYLMWISHLFYWKLPFIVQNNSPRKFLILRMLAEKREIFFNLKNFGTPEFRTADLPLQVPPRKLCALVLSTMRTPTRQLSRVDLFHRFLWSLPLPIFLETRSNTRRICFGPSIKKGKGRKLYYVIFGLLL